MTEPAIFIKWMDEKLTEFNDRLERACASVPSVIESFSVAGDSPFVSLRAIDLPEEAEKDTEDALEAEEPEAVKVLRLIQDSPQAQADSIERLESLLESLGDRVISVTPANGKERVYLAVTYYRDQAEEPKGGDR